MLKTENTCLVVIDLQEKLMPAIYGNEDLLKKSAALIKGIKLLDVPILVTQQYTKGLGPTIPQIVEALGDFEPIEKVTFSCLAEKQFRSKLHDLDKDYVIVIGAEAHICVQQTVLDLLDREHHNVYLIADCVGSRREMDKEFAIRRIEGYGAVVTTLESVLFELLHTAEHPRRKEIQALVMDL